MVGVSFSRDWNYAMMTIVTLKDEILQLKILGYSKVKHLYSAL